MAREHVQVFAAWHQHNRIDKRVRGLDVAESRVERETQADGVIQTLLKTHGSGQHHIPGSRMQRHHLVVIIRHRVGTSTVGGDDARPDDSHQHFFPLFWQLRFVSNDDVILH